MTDPELERGLRAWMQAEAASSPSATLRERVLATPFTMPPDPAPPTRARWLRPVALAEAAVIALLALSIGFLLISQRPDDQGAVVPGAIETDGGRASPSQDMEPKESEMELKSSLVAATAVAALTASTVSGQSTEVPAEFGGMLDYSGAAGPTVEGTQFYTYRTSGFDDSRMEGDWTLGVRATYFEGYSEPLWHGAFRVENDNGAWQQSPHLHLEYEDGTASTSTTPFIGEGDYEGLIALTEMHYMPAGHFEIRGVIVEGEPPEPPLAPSPS